MNTNHLPRKAEEVIYGACDERGLNVTLTVKNNNCLDYVNK